MQENYQQENKVSYPFKFFQQFLSLVTFSVNLSHKPLSTLYIMSVIDDLKVI